MTNKLCHSTYLKGCKGCQAYQREWARRKSLRALVDVATITPHVRELLDEMTIGELAAASGVGVRTISEIASARRPHCLRFSADRLKSVTKPAPRPDLRLRPATASTRRLQALAVIGVARGVAAERLGVHRTTLDDIVYGQRANVGVYLAKLIEAMFEEYCRQLFANWPEPMIPDGSKHARTAALASGWCGPLAWDDETIDDPDTLPNIVGAIAAHRPKGDVQEDNIARALAGLMRHVDLTTAERVIVVTRLAESGHTDPEIGRVLQWPRSSRDKPITHSAVQVFRSRHNIAHGPSTKAETDLEPQPAAVAH